MGLSGQTFNPHRLGRVSTDISLENDDKPLECYDTSLENDDLMGMVPYGTGGEYGQKTNCTWDNPSKVAWDKLCVKHVTITVQLVFTPGSKHGSEL